MDKDKRIKDVKGVFSGVGTEEEINGLVTPYATEGVIPKNRDAISLYVDEPCLEACQLLYDLNVQTYTSNGHIAQGSESKAYIGIVYDTLSLENKLIVQKLIKDGEIGPIMNNSGRGGGYEISIEVPIYSDSLVEEISKKLLDMAKKFVYQDVLYGRYTREELKAKYFHLKDNGLYEDFMTFDEIDENEVESHLEDYLKRGYINYVTDDGELYFASNDLLRKHIEYVESLENSRKK